MNTQIAPAMPQLWIGMPVYNAIRTVAKAVDSLLGQSHRDFILYISDNASTDGTSELLRTYAARDRRIRYIRQEKNRGASWNFSAVLSAADAPLFMWAASDDWWDRDFLRDNIEMLRRNPQAVLSASRTTFVERDGSLRASDDTSPLAGRPAANIAEYLHRPSTNSRFYGIHRRPVIKYAMHAGATAFLANDWAIMAHTLRFGGHCQVDRLQFYRHVGGASADRFRLLNLFRRDPLDFFFPMARCTLNCLRVGRANITLRMLLALARYNWEYAVLRFLPLLTMTPVPLKRAIHALVATGARLAHRASGNDQPGGGRREPSA